MPSTRHQQSDLFDSEPPQASPRALSIRPQGAAALGKEQRVFNRLVGQVARLRDKLTEWSEFEPQHHQRVLRELLPLDRQRSDMRRGMIVLIAQILAGKAGGGASGKAERRTLTAFLLELAGPHLAEAPDDAEIIALHDQYAVVSFAEDQALEREMARDFAEQMLGVELDEDAGQSIDEIMAAGMAKAREAHERRARIEENWRSQGPKARERAARKAAAAEQAAKEISQSVREVYRKLASALHPDRAADEADRVRRHALMQRANHAYDEDDLLSLLTLQLEIEQIDAAHLAQVSATRLRHYNSVLRAQMQELERELDAVRARYRELFDDVRISVTPALVEMQLQREIVEIRRHIQEMRAHQELLLRPVPRRRWLKEYAAMQREEEREEAALMREVMDEAEFFMRGMEPAPFGAPPGRPAASRSRAKKKQRRKRRR